MRKRESALLVSPGLAQRGRSGLQGAGRATEADRNPRILIVTFDPVTGSGGIEGRTVAYTSSLLKRGIHVQVAAISQAGLGIEELYLGTRLVRLSSSISRLPKTFSTLVRTITRYSINSVFFLSGGSTPVGILTLGFARLTGRKCGVFFYGRDILQTRKGISGGAFLTLSILLAGGVATNSRFTAGLLPIKPKRRVIIYPGVDPGMAKAGEAAVRDEFRPRILFVGRLIRRKGADILLSAFSQLRPELQAKLDIVGDGPEMHRLKAQAETLGLLDVVTFYGPMYGPRLWQRYAEASLFVMPSRESSEDVEGYGTVFLEAGVFGVPSVSTRTGGIPEAIIDGVTGKLLDSDDVGGLRDTIQGLLEDPDELQRLGKNARERAMTLSWDRSTNQVLELVGARNA